MEPVIYFTDIPVTVHVHGLDGTPHFPPYFPLVPSSWQVNNTTTPQPQLGDHQHYGYGSFSPVLVISTYKA